MCTYNIFQFFCRKYAPFMKIHCLQALKYWEYIGKYQYHLQSFPLIAFFSDFIPLLNLELEGLDDMADILRNKTSQAKMMIIFANIFPIFQSLQTMHFHEWRIFTTKKLKNMTINKKTQYSYAIVKNVYKWLRVVQYDEISQVL